MCERRLNPANEDLTTEHVPRLGLNEKDRKMKNWLLPLTLGLVSVGFIAFTGNISIRFVLERYGGDPFWVVLSVVAIAIEVLCAIGITELLRKKNYISAVLGIPFLCLAIITTVSFELGEFSQASSDTVASRQYEADTFNDNRRTLTNLRKKRDHALARGWSKTAEKYQVGIDQLITWAKGTTVSETDPRATVITRYTGTDPFMINDGFTTLIILFLLMGRTITPYWAYSLMPLSVKAPVNHHECIKSDTEAQSANTDNSNWTAQSAVEYFVDHSTRAVKGSRSGATVLYRGYCMFATNHGLPWLQQKDFGEALGNLGLKKTRMPGNGSVSNLDIELSEAA